MSQTFRKGARVRWNWGQGVGRGHIAERFDRPVERHIEGVPVRRNGSPANPAYLIHADNGAQVLKLSSEIHTA
ncbi:DUF2945 domain-containing protein [Sphingobium terrigena]|uniref:DUF2945 domain-containing protein n=1 Tax=Sphingobium terrigena TaxID=2304063 RepID=A0A418YQU9_9SPHN|nr:DUF2945 domain-containing protein [Sphingobium terrigena]RJG53925.1 DUF2945 domain-containing protein [Sphingobium terrigena]